jgi:hypothetical protein
MAKNHKRPLAIIYVPGLGDRRVQGQRFALKTWRLQGVEPYLFQMKWASGEPFQVTFDRLLRLIDRLHQEGKAVGMVGASAGASVALLAYAARPQAVIGVGCICGKIAHPETVSPTTVARNPAFGTAMERLPATVAGLTESQRQAIISLKPLRDHVVSPQDTLIEGARSATLPVVGHLAGIAYGLTLGSGRIIRFLRRKSAET